MGEVPGRYGMVPSRAAALLLAIRHLQARMGRAHCSTLNHCKPGHLSQHLIPYSVHSLVA